jgi:glycogen debranching enzyme
MTNVLYNLSRMALGQPSLTPVILERMHDSATGLFRPLARPEPTRRTAITWAALSPLALPDLPEEIGRRLVEEHLLDPRSFLTAVSPPSVAVSDPTFTTDDQGPLGLRRYWRGPTWVNSGWLLWLGLVRLGYHEHANELARRLAGAIAVERLREYYNPFSGRGMGAVDFGWSSLIMEMLEPDERVASSYL